MNVLVTGGTGFIGSRLALRARADGHTVRVLAQVNTEAEERNRADLEGHGVECIDGSVADADRVRAAVAGMETIYHLAAAQHEANVGEEHFRRVNVEGTRNVLEAALAGGVRRVVHGSTIGVYGSAARGRLSEDTPPVPVNVYGRTKLEGERLALSYAERIPVAVVRISETYGPGDRRLLKLFRAIEAGTFFMIGRGHNLHQLIYVDDLVEGLLAAAVSEQAPGEVFVLAGPEVLTTRDMVEIIGSVLGRRGSRFTAPMWPFLLAAVVLENTLGRVGVQPPLHRRRLDFFRKSFYFAREKSAKRLGFEAKTDFRSGAESTVRWYREQGLLRG